jgi:hypothetical protein
MPLEFRALPGRRAHGPAYHVMEGESAVGRICQANGTWKWIVYSHRIEGVAPGGQALTFEEARHFFKQAWEPRPRDEGRVTSGLEF